MPDSIELERMYLAKYIPKDLEKFDSKEVIDIYIPKSKEHPTLRVRKNGNKFMITKKEPSRSGDKTEMIEQTIPLTEEEYQELSKLEGKRVAKIRYFYDYKGRKAEIAVFKEDLEGLVMVDFEFDDLEDRKNFKVPDFCLVEVTDQEFLAGGKLCGERYGDIENELKKLGYSKIEKD